MYSTYILLYTYNLCRINQLLKNEWSIMQRFNSAGKKQHKTTLSVTKQLFKISNLLLVAYVDCIL